MPTVAAYLIASLLGYALISATCMIVEAKRGFWAAWPRPAFQWAAFVACLPWALIYLAWDHVRNK